MHENESLPEPANLNLGDYMLLCFSHRWKLVACLALGIFAAGIAYLFYVPEYESEAKLLVRYVVDKSSIDVADSQVKPASGNYGDNLMSAEVDILTSWDLKKSVAEELTTERLVPRLGPSGTITDAVLAIQSGLSVAVSRGSNVITVAYRNRDPELAKLVLSRLVTRYFEKHLQIHRSIGTFEFVNQQTEDVRARLNQTEDDLRRLKTKLGIRSLENAEAGIDSRMKALQTELDAAESQQAEQEAKINAFGRITEGEGRIRNQSVDLRPQAHSVTVERHRELSDDLNRLIKNQPELKAKYARGNRILVMNELEIANLRAEIRDLERKFPGISTMAPVRELGQASDMNLELENAKLAAISAKIEKLRSQLIEVDGAAARLSEVETEVKRLQRTKEADEKSMMYFQSSLEKARIDEALDPSKMPNISIVQNPSPGLRVGRNLRKLIFGLIGGGGVVGIALVFLMEFVIDPSVKRPGEIQVQMGIPLLLSIPYFENCARSRALQNGTGQKLGAGAIWNESKIPVSNDSSSLLRSFESLRDRLIVFFELNNVKHRPKLVAVASCSGGGGTSTIAGGLAAALAETGDGKVLLVDMNSAHASIHPSFEGRPTCTVADALQSGKAILPASENLYLAKADASGAGSLQLVPRRFSDLVPHFKTSVYDYIVFDMPSLDQSCAVLAIAGSVDKVLLVAEAGKTHREVLKRAYGELVGARANVSCVMNKNRACATA